MIFSKKYLLVTPNPYNRDREICDSRAGAAAAHITTRSNNGYLLACYDIVLDENGCLQSAKRIGKNEETQGTKWYAYVETPFSRRIGLEWCYLLGDFNVQVFGEFHRITPKTGLLGFADVTTQGLAHYGGNITYCIPVKTNGGALSVTVPHYAGTGLRCTLGRPEKHLGQCQFLALCRCSLDRKLSAEGVGNLFCSGDYRNLPGRLTTFFFCDRITGIIR